MRDLAETLSGLGHHVSVLAPAEDEESLDRRLVTFAGRTVPIPYNGSVAGCRSARCRPPGCAGGSATGSFDVLHVHEPVAP